MELNLIQLNDNLPEKLKPSYDELEQKIIDQDCKIKLLENMVYSIEKNISIINDLYNNFTIEIECININDLTDEALDFINGKNSNNFTKINKSLIKTKIINLNCEHLNLTNIILHYDKNCNINRLKNLYKIKNLLINKYVFVIDCINQYGFDIHFLDGSTTVGPYYTSDNFKDLTIYKRNEFCKNETPNIIIM